MNAFETDAPLPDRRWRALVVLCAGFLMIVVDMTIVNVALPSIQKDLGFSQSSLAWVVNAYLVPYGGLLLLAGRLGDLVGRKRVFMVGLGLFVAASLVCGLSFSQPMLIAARFVQGIGGAVSSAVILGMIVTMFPEPLERARAIGVFSFIASAGGAIGLLAGGLITQEITWHWIFFVNLPIGLATILLAWRLVAADRGIGLTAGADVLGAALITAALMLGIYTIVEFGSPTLGLAESVGLGILTVVLLVAFALRQVFASNPIVPLNLVRERPVWAANLVQALMVAGFFAFFFLGSLDLERVLGYGPMAIGLAFLPVAIAMAVLSVRLSASLIVRFGARRVLLSGQGMIVVGLGALALSPTRGLYLRDLLPALVLLGVGGGLSFPGVTIAAMEDVEEDNAGFASGLLNTTAQVGGALGLAVLATLATDQTSTLLARHQPLATALSGGYHLAWTIGAGLALTSLLLAIALVRPLARPESEDLWIEQESA